MKMGEKIRKNLAASSWLMARKMVPASPKTMMATLSELVTTMCRC
jgi:hypothetical protein